MMGVTVLSLILYIPMQLAPKTILSWFIKDAEIAGQGVTDFLILFSTYIVLGFVLLGVPRVPRCPVGYYPNAVPWKSDQGECVGFNASDHSVCSAHYSPATDWRPRCARRVPRPGCDRFDHFRSGNRDANRRISRLVPAGNEEKT